MVPVGTLDGEGSREHRLGKKDACLVARRKILAIAADLDNYIREQSELAVMLQREALLSLEGLPVDDELKQSMSMWQVRKTPVRREGVAA